MCPAGRFQDRAILAVDIIGFTETHLFGAVDFAILKGLEPIKHALDTDGQCEVFTSRSLALGAPELTSEVDPMLVSKFRPAYNTTLFKKYPNIEKGTRSAGYTASELVVESMPALLKTDHYSMAPHGV